MINSQFNYSSFTDEEHDKMYNLAKKWASGENCVDISPVEIHQTFLVEGLIDKGSVNIFYGHPKSGKTLAVQSLSHHLVLGKTWCGHHIQKHCNVLYFGFEDPDSLKLRQSALAQNEDLELNDERGYMKIVSTDIPDLETDFSFQTIVYFFEYLRDNGPEIEHNEVLVIDTLNMAFSHLGNENDAQFMAEVAKVARRFAQCGITVIIIHHSGKDIARGMRGHTALAGAVDNVFVCQKKGRTHTEIKQEMWRNGLSGKPIKLELKSVSVSFLQEAKEQITQVPMVNFEGTNSQTSATLTSGQIIFLHALAKMIINDPTDYIIEFGIPENVRIAALQDVVDAAIEAKISPNSSSYKSAKKTAVRIKDSLVDNGTIMEKDGFIWRVPENDKTD